MLHLGQHQVPFITNLSENFIECRHCPQLETLIFNLFYFGFSSRFEPYLSNFSYNWPGCDLMSVLHLRPFLLTVHCQDIRIRILWKTEFEESFDKLVIE